MTVSAFSGCDETCGYVAAVCAMLAWGSFGVPLKNAKAASTTPGGAAPEVNFFVLQSYKTSMCFLTCWLVLLLGVPVRFSYWGIVSGLFWVPGAACGIYGIRNAGLAIAVGTWSSIQVLTSFLFGIVVFQEEVRNMERATMAFCCLIAGLVGMARYAGMGSSGSGKSGNSSSSTPSLTHSLSLTTRLLDVLDVTSSSSGTSSPPIRDSSPQGTKRQPPSPISGTVRKTIRGDSNVGNSSSSNMTPMEIDSSETSKKIASNIAQYNNINFGNGTSSVFEDEERVLRGARAKDSFYMEDSSIAREKSPMYKDHVVFCGGRFALHRKQMGLLGAVINGAWGGCSLIPLHYAKRDHGLSGADYLISYATGSAIVNIVMWLLLFLYHYLCNSNTKHRWSESLHALPKWHLQQLWWPGFLSGTLYSIGNFCGILAVTYLGQATGFSACQGQLFVSGLWAVFWFREIKQPAVILMWFSSAFLAIFGIIWLSWEHKGSSGGH